MNRKKKNLIVIVVLIVLILGFRLVISSNPALFYDEPAEDLPLISEEDVPVEEPEIPLPEEPEAPEIPVIESEDPVEEVITLDLTFRTEKNLREHYEKHGIDMGFDSAEDYLYAANLVIVDPDVLHKTEKEDGDDVYYLEATNEFVVVSKDGYIRTYFLPDAGKKYYDKQ